MADLNSLALGPPDTKKRRLDPLGSESSDVIGNLLDDLGDELPGDLLPGDYDPLPLTNDTSSLLNSNVAPQLKNALPHSQPQQNALGASPQASQALPPNLANNSTNQMVRAASGNLSTSQSGFNSTSTAGMSGGAATNASATQPGQQHPPPGGGAAPPQVSSNSSSPSQNPTINMYPNTNSMANSATPGSSLADITSSLDTSGTSLPSSQPQTPQQQQQHAQLQQQPPRQNVTPTPPSGPVVPQNPQTPQQQQQQQPPQSQQQQQPQQGLSMSANVPTPPPPGQQPQTGIGAPSSAGGFGGAFPGMNQQGGRPFPGGQQPAGQTSDPEKRKQIQQQLVLLLHAHKCQRREREQLASGDYRQCTLPHCKTMKNVLNHMTKCQAGRSCSYPHCASSRQIIAHWKNCQRTDCPVCLPLKHASLTTHGRRPGVDPSGQAPGMSPAGSSGGNMGMGHGGAGMGMGPGTSQFPGNLNMNMLGGGQATGGFNHMMSSGSGMGHPGQVRNMYGMGQQPGPGGYPNPMGNPMAAGPAMQRRASYPLPIPPIVSQPTQPWHDQVNPDLRQHLVKKLVEAIYPVHDPLALQDSRVHSLVQYAMKVEKVMFEAATNREEYYKLLAQKIYHIRKELEDRKNQKKFSVVLL